MRKSALEKAIIDKNYSAIAEILRKSPGKARILLSGLYETNEKQLDTILETFQVIAKVLEEERVSDLLRRLMWFLNEESGNSCPNAALAIGHIAHARYHLVEPHLPVLKIYANDPSAIMRTKVRHALAMIKIASLNAK